MAVSRLAKIKELQENGSTGRQIAGMEHRQQAPDHFSFAEKDMQQRLEERGVPDDEAAGVPDSEPRSVGFRPACAIRLFESAKIKGAAGKTSQCLVDHRAR